MKKLFLYTFLIFFFSTTKAFALNLAQTVALNQNNKIYTLAQNEIVNQNLGTLVGNSLSIVGQSGFIIDGQNFSGITTNLGQTLNITSVSSIENFESLLGGFVNNLGTTNVTSSSFSDNTGTSAGGVFRSTGALNISDSTFSNNKGGNPFGSSVISNIGTLYVENSTFSSNIDNAVGNVGNIEIVGSTFNGNDSTVNGGAINNKEEGVVNTNILSTLYRTTFTSNRSNLGGAIFNDGLASININQADFTSNQAFQGGAVYNEGIYALIINSTFQDNETIGSTGANGGAIYNAVGSDLGVVDSSFTNNTAAQLGGAIYNAGEVNLSAIDEIISFSGNSATEGGAIYNTGTVDLNASGNRIIILDSISGSNGTLNINQNGGTEVAIGSSVENNQTNFYQGTLSLLSGASLDNLNADFTLRDGTSKTLNTIDGTTTTYTIGELDMTNTVLALDMDLSDSSNLVADNFDITGQLEAYTGVSRINLTGVPTTDITNGTVTIFSSANGTDNVTLATQEVAIATPDALITLNQDTTAGNRGNYIVNVDTSENFNLDLAIELNSAQTQYTMTIPETVIDQTIEFQDGLGQTLGKNMFVSDFVTTKAEATINPSSSSNTLTLIKNSVFETVNINLATGVNFDLTADDGSSSIIFGAYDSQRSSTSSISVDIGSNITSTNIDNSVTFSGTGTHNASGLFSLFTLNANSEINRTNYDSGVDINLNSGGILNYGSDFEYLYNPQRHGVDLTLNSLNFAGGTLPLQNDQIDTLKFETLGTSFNTNLSLDADLENITMDTLNSNSAGSTSGFLNVDSINLMSDANEDRTEINFTSNSQFASTVKYTGISEIAYSPLYQYNVEYDSSTGNFIFTRTADIFNPSLLAAPVAAQLGGYLTQLNSYDMAFKNMDMYMLMPKSKRISMKMRNKYANTSPNNVFDPTSTQYEDEALWFRPYSTFENVGLRGGVDVSNVAYGSFFGAETKMQELPYGFDVMYGVYGGYNGSHQAYDGIGIYQNGGTLGFISMLYKENFFSGLTINSGANGARAQVVDGVDNFGMLMGGIASKSGYNFEFFDGKFIIQPSYLMSYTFVNTFDFKTNSDINMSSDFLNAIQIEPAIKFIGNLENSWQPYLGVSFVLNLIDATKFKANDVALPELSVSPFVRYGVGVRKSIGEVFTGFFQAFITNGGRNGVGLQLGLRWNI